MSVTVQESRELRHIERQLAAQGIEGGAEFTKINEKRQWYKPDGTPLPTLLPADEYHVRLYMSKGWTLVPPRHVAEKPKGPSLIEQELERNRKAAEQKAGKGEELSPVEAEVRRETANKQEDDLRRQTPPLGVALGECSVEPTPTATEEPHVSFLANMEPPEPPKAEESPTLPCPEPGCEYAARGKTLKLRKARLEKHTYGPFSKHHKEKQDG